MIPFYGRVQASMTDLTGDLHLLLLKPILWITGILDPMDTPMFLPRRYFELGVSADEDLARASLK